MYHLPYTIPPLLSAEPLHREATYNGVMSIIDPNPQPIDPTHLSVLMCTHLEVETSDTMCTANTTVFQGLDLNLPDDSTSLDISLGASA